MNILSYHDYHVESLMVSDREPKAFAMLLMSSSQVVNLGDLIASS